MPVRVLLALLAFVVGSGSLAGGGETVDTVALSSGWRFRQNSSERWARASVPGCVHTDLLADGQIEDPSYRLNEADQQWVGYADWEYETSFDLSTKVLARRHARLVFEGLDTYAEVYLNGHHILSADNMFRKWTVDCKQLLKPGGNVLRVCFRNVFSRTLPQLEASTIPLKAFTNNDQAKVKVNMYVRKAGFHFGWDWGPRLVTCGVWRPVLLQSWDGLSIENVFYEQKRVTKERADVVAHIELAGDCEGPVELLVRDGEREYARKEVNLKPGQRTLSLAFSVDQPKRWWTHDLGEQPLYQFEAEILSQGRVADSRTDSIGLRDLKIIRERDEHGRAMHVELNGVPLFVKGANYIPQDNFQSRVTASGYHDVIDSARAANMNMLRVWGGGIYEEDLFYDLCDRAGVLVWQDMMFACAMYPADEAFLANVRAEVIDNAVRLRNHPSVAMYCGNNEVEISWFEWGWKDKYNEDQQRSYEADLRRLFYSTIPEALAEADPTRYYHPSSPIAGFDDKPNHDGDLHYWGVWHGKEPFEDFEKNVGRFMSEYGFQSYPSMKTVSRFTELQDRSLNSDVMYAHQRSRAEEGSDLDYGNRLINRYLERYFPDPEGFESHLLTTQLVQAYGVQAAIEAHRRRKPYCMGTLYWQINDCWPVASWSSIDYYGEWKALHYTAKRSYAPTILPTVQRGDDVEVYVVSDHVGEDFEAQLLLEVSDLSGEQLWTNAVPLMVSNASGRLAATVSMHEFSNFAPDEAFLSASLVAGGKTIASAIHCFVPPKSLELEDPELTWSARAVEGGYDVTLRSERFACYAFLETEKGKARFSDNFFHMRPGRDYTVRLATDQPLDAFGTLVVRSLYDLSATDAKGKAIEPLRNASSVSGSVGR